MVTVVKPSHRGQILLNIRKAILERYLTNVVYVSGLLHDLQTLLSTRKYILNSNIIDLIYVTVLLFKAQTQSSSFE